MNEAYVSFETAKLLKEKGFDWECIGYYVDSEPKEVMFSMCGELNSTWESRCCSAPTQQMACKWLREKGVTLCAAPTNKDWTTWTFYFYVKFDTEKGEEKQENFTSYEKALEEGIKYVLKNLI